MSNASDFVIKKGILTEYTGPGGDVVIPEGVSAIGEFTEWGNKRITSLTLPESLTKIEQHAFGSDCLRMETLLIPQNVIEISAHQLFGDCSALAAVEVSTDNTFFSSQDGVLFDREKNKLLACPPKKTGKYIIPNSVNEICDCAFDSCSKLKEITIPNGVKRIGWMAFYRCHALTEITFPSSVSIIDKHTLDGCDKIKHVTILGTLEDAKPATEYKTATCSVTVPHWTPAVTKFLAGLNVETVETGDFSAVPASYRAKAALGYVIKKHKAADIGEDAQYETFLSKNAAKLCTVAFENPDLLFFLCEHQLISAKDIDTYLAEAEKCDAEKKALLLDYQNKLGVEKVSKARAKKEKVKEEYEDALVERKAARDPAKGIEGLTFVITGSFSSFPKIWDNRNEVKTYLERHGAHLAGSVTKKTDYLVTNDKESESEKNRKAKEYGAQVINEAEFNEMIGKRYKKDERNIVLPAWIKEVPKRAFMYCEKLETVTIHAGITSIGDQAFKDCKSLTNVTIPEGVTSIGDSAFWCCSRLSSVTIPDSVNDINAYAFSICPYLTIHAPSGSYAEQYAKKHNIPFVAE